MCEQNTERSVLSNYIVQEMFSKTELWGKKIIVLRTLNVSHSFSGKTYLIMKQLKLVFKSKYSLWQDLLHKITFEFKTEDEIRGKTKHRGSFVVFEDMLEYHQKPFGPFISWGRHKELDVHSLSQSFFGLPKKTMKKQQ